MISAFGRQGQKDCQFETSLNCIAILRENTEERVRVRRGRVAERARNRYPQRGS